MRKNFNAQKYNERMDRIFEQCKEQIKKRERINSIKQVISSLDNWEIQELKEFIENGVKK